MLSVSRGQSITIENGDNVPLVFEGNGLYVGEVVVPANGRITVAVKGNPGQYRLVDERGHSAVASITVQLGEAVEPLTDEVNAVGALTILEGHVRASKELHDRGVSKQGPDPALDLKRAGKHAGHPQHELLMGNEPHALNVQKFLRAHNVFDSLNNALAQNGKHDQLTSLYLLMAESQKRGHCTPDFRGTGNYSAGFTGSLVIQRSARWRRETSP